MKELINNFSYSIGIHFIKIIMPFLLFPIIARYVGAEGLGEFAFYQAITIIVASVIEYGYSYSAINKIVTSNKIGVYNTIKEVEISRLFLSILVIIISISISIYKSDYLITISVTTGVLIGLLPAYLYQSYGKFKSLAIIEFFSLLFYYFLSFIFLYITPAIWGVILSLMISRIIAYFWSINKIELVRYNINNESIRVSLLSLKSNFIYFCHRASIVIYSTFTVIIIKYLYDDNILGFYSSAEKIVVALCAISGPIQSVLLPYLSKHKRKNIIVICYTFLITSTICFSIISSYFSTYIFTYYYGDNFAQGGIYYSSLIWLFPLKIISSLISTDLFLSKGLQRYFSSIYLSIISIALPVLFVLTYFYGIHVMILTLLVSEIILILSLLIKYKLIKTQDIKNAHKKK